LAEYGADAAGDARHNGARRDGHETSHHGILNQILALAVPPYAHEKKQSSIVVHFHSFGVVFVPQKSV
jgi:hypothetical protein